MKKLFFLMLFAVCCAGSVEAQRVFVDDDAAISALKEAPVGVNYAVDANVADTDMAMLASLQHRATRDMIQIIEDRGNTLNNFNGYFSEPFFQNSRISQANVNATREFILNLISKEG